ncbi:type II toxin-antitoxin system Phd/YefM family antitoxin [Corynebacterium sp. ZY180755]|jgi:prevent-host-death family protein
MQHLSTDLTREAPITVRDAKLSLSRLVQRVEEQNHRVIITEHGRSVAALVSIEDLERLERLQLQADIREMEETN